MATKRKNTLGKAIPITEKNHCVIKSVIAQGTTMEP